MNRRTALLPLLVLLAGCLGDEAITDPKELTFSPELGVNLSAMTLNPSGLYWQDQVVGTGPVVATVGSSVTVDYTGWLHTGRQFDSSAGKPPFTILSLGSGEVIPGWDEGLMGMRAGGRRLLVIPPHLGYGSSSAGIIPPYATLVFRVDMKSVAAR